MIEAESLIRECAPDVLRHVLFQMFGAFMLCTKHPAFFEEQEWRIFHTAGVHNQGKLLCEVEAVRGIPQIVYKIPLTNFPDVEPLGNAIPDLLDRIVIGPSPHPRETREAFVQILALKGIQNPQEKVTISGIPLR